MQIYLFRGCDSNSQVQFYNICFYSGARMAIEECQAQFSRRRWNCPTVDNSHGGSIFGNILKKGKVSNFSFYVQEGKSYINVIKGNWETKENIDGYPSGQVVFRFAFEYMFDVSLLKSESWLWKLMFLCLLFLSVWQTRFRRVNKKSYGL